MRLRRGPGIEIKTPEEFARMREAGLVVCRTLKVLADAVRPGITTADLDEIAAREIEAAGAVPSFLGYFGYPSVICTSVNEQIVHGIPDPAQRLRSGDIISIDCGAVLDGWHGDAALTAPVGEISAEDQALLDACETARLTRGGALRAGELGDRRSWRRWPPVRHHPRVHRPRHRDRDAHGADRPELRRRQPWPPAAGWHGPGHRADDHARRRADDRAGRWLDGRHR